MSTLAAVVQASATPLPSPQVTKEFFTQIPAQTPAVVIQAAQLAAMFVAALVLSVAHKVAEWLTAKEKGWGPQVNAGLATLYSFGVGLVGTASMHQLGADTTQLVTLGISTAVALAGSFWTYALRQASAKLTSAGSDALPTTTNP